MRTPFRTLRGLTLGVLCGLTVGVCPQTPSVLAAPVPAATWQKPVEQKIVEENRRVKIHVRYPQFGVDKIDRDIRQWALGIAGEFRSEYGGEALSDTHMPYLLDITYEVVAPPKGMLSVIWQEASYTAGAHGQLNLLSINYAPETGEPVALLDVFESPSMALRIMSAHAEKVLSRRLADMKVDDMLREGLLPEADNFATFAITPAGLRVYFPPYQVAPWAAGPQSVDIPLEILKPAGPRLRYWGK